MSGESLVEMDLGSFLEMLPAGMSPVRALKKHLHSMLGLSRFRQRLVYLGDDTILDDDHTLRAGEVQLLRLNFCQASEAQMLALRDAARSGLRGRKTQIHYIVQARCLWHPSKATSR